MVYGEQTEVGGGEADSPGRMSPQDHRQGVMPWTRGVVTEVVRSGWTMEIV